VQVSRTCAAPTAGLIPAAPTTAPPAATCSTLAPAPSPRERTASASLSSPSSLPGLANAVLGALGARCSDHPDGQRPSTTHNVRYRSCRRPTHAPGPSPRIYRPQVPGPGPPVFIFSLACAARPSRLRARSKVLRSTTRHLAAGQQHLPGYASDGQRRRHRGLRQRQHLPVLMARLQRCHGTGRLDHVVD
jgi:hypothetical protein